MNENCPRATFAEQQPAIIAKYGRKTNRLKQALVEIPFESGVEAGANLARKLHIMLKPDTLLRMIRNYEITKPETVRILGIDDFAFRKGNTYGTLLIDLEKHEPVDLLSDRKSATLSAWLRTHPGIEIITRDPSKEYARGVTEVSPDIIQITDRWHLLQNIREALERMLNRFRDRLKRLPVDDELATYDKTSQAGRLRKPTISELELREALLHKRKSVGK
jgi:transposase